MTIRDTESARPLSAAEAVRIAALIRGDETALAEVLQWIRAAVGSHGGRLAPERDEIEREVVLELLGTLSAGRFEGRSPLAPYVRRLAHRVCVDRGRAQRARQWAGAGEGELVQPGPAAAASPRRRGELEIGLRVVAEMPESCRELWGMIHRGLGYEAMSESLGIAVETLRVRVLRCREQSLAIRDRLAAAGSSARARGI